MKFKDLFDKIFSEEEEVKRQFEFLKDIIKQSYYFLETCFKLKVLYNKEACRKTVFRHWIYDEFIGNCLMHCVYYFKGNITKEEIVNNLMSNFENNYQRLKKDITAAYKDLADKDDFLEENVKKLAYDCYSRFADWIISNRNNLKNITRENYENLAFYVLDMKKGE